MTEEKKTILEKIDAKMTALDIHGTTQRIRVRPTTHKQILEEMKQITGVELPRSSRIKFKGAEVVEDEDLPFNTTVVFNVSYTESL